MKGIDGGPILKWSLVDKGRSLEEADETVKKVNLALGSGLGIAAGAAMKKRRIWLGVAIKHNKPQRGLAVLLVLPG
jgi:hypothetical protein